MEESDTYLAIIDEGQKKFARRAILRLGEDRLGTPSDAVRAAVLLCDDLEQLDRMLLHFFRETSWEEIVQTP